MEFEFDVKRLLPDDISRITNKLEVNGRKSILNDSEKKVQLLTVIDRLGRASAKAQDLHAQVTTADKFLSSDHTLYVIKDETKRLVVGILKMGKKKLFVLDKSGSQHEMLPLCVLDFYVHESRQRMGYGKLLFEHMLQEENIKVNLLAIDRPSAKFLAFLRKHYQLSKTIPQVNNFVIFEGFFRDKQMYRRKSLDSFESQSRYSSYNTESGASEHPPLMERRSKNSVRSSYPFYSENRGLTWNEKSLDEKQQGLKPHYDVFSRYETSPNDQNPLGNNSSKVSPNSWQSQSTLGLLQWPGEESTSTQSQSIDSSVPSPSKLTPNKSSCGSHGEDSTMKIFGVPSAWTQTSGH